MENDLISRSGLSEDLAALTMTITGLRAGKGVLREFMTEYRESVLRIVDEVPAVDAVEVIRCEKCKYARQRIDGHLVCDVWSDDYDTVVGSDDFCSYGERRGDNGE